MRVRTQHIPAGPELSLGGNLVTWVNAGARANDVKGHYNISWLLRKTKQKCQNDPTPQVAAYLLCSVADNLPRNTAITLDPKAGGQFISQLHPTHRCFLLSCNEENLPPLISLPSSQDPHSSIHRAPGYLLALKITCHVHSCGQDTMAAMEPCCCINVRRRKSQALTSSDPIAHSSL